jgi:hypothetical protein
MLPSNPAELGPVAEGHDKRWSVAHAFALWSGSSSDTLQVVALLWSSSGDAARNDPWRGNTLEWFTQSRPAPHNFGVIPRVRSVEPMKDIRREVAVARPRRLRLSPSPPRPGVSDGSGGGCVRGRLVADGQGLDLGPDAAEQLVVGVAERAHALALELAGDGFEIDARVA